MTLSYHSKKTLKQFVRVERGQEDDSLKTAVMLRLERRFNKSIYELLDGRKNGAAIGKELGVTESCVSKWRKRLGIQPIHQICSGCNRTMPLIQRVCGYCGIRMTGKFAQINNEGDFIGGRDVEEEKELNG